MAVLSVADDKVLSFLGQFWTFGFAEASRVFVWTYCDLVK